MSQDLVRGSRIKVMLGLIFMIGLTAFVFGMAQFAMMRLAGMPMMQEMYIFRAVVSCFATPLMSLFMAFMYRSLTK